MDSDKPDHKHFRSWYEPRSSRSILLMSFLGHGRGTGRFVRRVTSQVCCRWAGSHSAPPRRIQSTRSPRPPDSHPIQTPTFFGNLRNGILIDSETGESQWSARELRTLCSCPQCIDPSDKQLNYSFAHIPSGLRIASHDVDQDGTYTVRWQNDVPGFADHVSVFKKRDIMSLADLRVGHFRNIPARPICLWKSDSYSIDAATIKYADFMSEETALGEVLHRLWESGLVFVSHVPREQSSVARIAERIAVLRHTFYGSTWDVKSIPKAKNVAYTSKHLGYHMDLLYMREPPGIQLLHCLDNTCTGGESAFADTFSAAASLKAEQPDIYSTLSTFRVPYEYNNDGHHYKDYKPVISLHGPLANRYVANSVALGRIGRVYWSPPFIGTPLKSVAGQATDDFLQAASVFSRIIESPGFGIEHKLPAGTCAIFDNLR